MNNKVQSSLCVLSRVQVFKCQVRDSSGGLRCSCLRSIPGSVQRSAGRAPPYRVVAARRWRHTNELIGLYVLNDVHKKGKSLAAGMHIVSLCSNVFHYYSTSIRLSYIPARLHGGALWEFSSASVAMVGIPPPHMPHHPLKPLLLLSP